MQPSAPGTDAAPRPSRVVRVLWPLLVLTWFVAVPVLVGRGFAASLTFLGESPSAGETATSRRFYVAAACVAVVVPVLGLVVSGLARSRAGLVVFVVLVLVGAVFGLVVARDVHRAEVRDQPPAARVTVCQERSGGGTDCPGG